MFLTIFSDSFKRWLLLQGIKDVDDLAVARGYHHFANILLCHGMNDD